jgi:hypothetical protein
MPVGAVGRGVSDAPFLAQFFQPATTDESQPADDRGFRAFGASSSGAIKWPFAVERAARTRLRGTFRETERRRLRAASVDRDS